jgi:Necrosis inducing protein (NPP1)
VYSAHLFELYFLKDQATVFGGGHRHDIESVLVYFKGSSPTHVLVSAHGKWISKTYAEVAKDNLRPKVVYHKDGLLTHALRHASSSEAPENPYGRWVLPKLLSWNHAMVANTLSNTQYRSKINTFNFGDASFKQKDSNFATKLNEAKPSGYPNF